MTKYKLFLLVLAFVFGLFNLNSASAVNCAPGELFNTSTGQTCSTTTTVVKCSTGDLFSSVTGQPCTVWQDNSALQEKIVILLDTLFKRELAVGSKGEDVKALQQILKDVGFLSGKVDGSYGPITQSAVTKYQKENNITSTGKADLETFKKIKTTPLSGDVGDLTSSTVSSPSLGLDTVTILSPKEGETYKAGDVMNITWQVNKNVSSNDTFVVTVAPQWHYITTKDDQYMLSSQVLSSNIRSYSWIIPDPLPPHDPFPFRVNVGFCQSPDGGKQILVDGAYSSCLNSYAGTVFNVKIIPSQATANPVPVGIVAQPAPKTDAPVSICPSSGLDPITGLRCGCTTTSVYSLTTGATCNTKNNNSSIQPSITSFTATQIDSEGWYYKLAWATTGTNQVMFEQHPSVGGVSFTSDTGQDLSISNTFPSPGSVNVRLTNGYSYPTKASFILDPLPLNAFQSLRKTVTVDVPGGAGPIASSFSPSSGVAGTRVTIYGSKFLSTGNDVAFVKEPGGPEFDINNLPSSDGTTLSFIIPNSTDVMGEDGIISPVYVTPGKYYLVVINVNGKSDVLHGFTVTD